MTTRQDLIEAAGGILAIIHRTDAGVKCEVDDRSADLQRTVIALAARGLMLPSRLGRVPADAFTGAPRLFAWWCAERACSRLGRRSTFFAARYVRVTAPALDLPLEEWADLNHETDDELDAAEAIDAPTGEAVGRLLLDHRGRLLRDWLAPVLSGIASGDPMADTAARLRQAADIFEGRT